MRPSLVRYSLPKPDPVEIKFYNIMGQLVRTLAEGELAAGKYFFSGSFGFLIKKTKNPANPFFICIPGKNP